MHDSNTPLTDSAARALGLEQAEWGWISPCEIWGLERSRDDRWIVRLNSGLSSGFWLSDAMAADVVRRSAPVPREEVARVEQGAAFDAFMAVIDLVKAWVSAGSEAANSETKIHKQKDAA